MKVVSSSPCSVSRCRSRSFSEPAEEEHCGNQSGNWRGCDSCFYLETPGVESPSISFDKLRIRELLCDSIRLIKRGACAISCIKTSSRMGDAGLLANVCTYYKLSSEW